MKSKECKERIEQLSKLESEIKRAKNVMLLDLRTTSEYQTYHVPGAMLIATPKPPLSGVEIKQLRTKLTRVLDSIDRTSTLILVYCKKGIRAAAGVKLLRKLGFRVHSLGGVDTFPLNAMQKL